MFIAAYYLTIVCVEIKKGVILLPIIHWEREIFTDIINRTTYLSPNYKRNPQ